MRWALVVAALCLPVAAAPAPARLCSPVTCASGVFVDTKGLERTHPTAATVTLCVDDRCRRWRASEGVVSVRRQYRRSRAVRVRLVVRDAQGRRLLRVSRRARLVRRQPNGPGCSPVCWSSTMRLDATAGRLVET